MGSGQLAGDHGAGVITNQIHRLGARQFQGRHQTGRIVLDVGHLGRRVGMTETGGVRRDHVAGLGQLGLKEPEDLARVGALVKQGNAGIGGHRGARHAQVDLAPGAVDIRSSNANHACSPSVSRG